MPVNGRRSTERSVLCSRQHSADGASAPVPHACMLETVCAVTHWTNTRSTARSIMVGWGAAKKPLAKRGPPAAKRQPAGAGEPGKRHPNRWRGANKAKDKKRKAPAAAGPAATLGAPRHWAACSYSVSVVALGDLRGTMVDLGMPAARPARADGPAASARRLRRQRPPSGRLCRACACTPQPVSTRLPLLQAASAAMLMISSTC
jgi:hypothetical protein